MLGAFLNFRNQRPESRAGLDSLQAKLDSHVSPAPDYGALDRLHRALRLSPSDPFLWADLGEAYASSNQISNARFCLQTAAGLGSHIDPILLRVAIFHARIGEYYSALPYLKTILETDAASYGPIFDFYQRKHLLTGSNLGTGIPLSAGPAQAYFRYNMEHTELVEETWLWLSMHSLLSIELANALNSPPTIVCSIGPSLHAHMSK